MIKVLSLFDGIGGAREALKELDIDCKYYASEIDKYAIQIAKKNNEDINHIGDIRAIFVDKDYLFYDHKIGVKCFLPSNNFDLVIAGPPCQSFSIAGKKKGFEDERGQLFFKAARILKAVRPKNFVFENVASMSKENQDIISQKLGVEPIIINSDRFLPQNRKRLYWTNIKIEELPQRPLWKEKYYQWRRSYFRENKSGVCPTLTANMGTGGHNVPLKTQNLKDKLTVGEVANLQGFDKDYCNCISKTQGYKAIGNSFTIPVIKHILKNILK